MSKITALDRVRIATRALFAPSRSFEDWSEEDEKTFVLGALTKAGTRVNESSSMRLSSVFAAVNIYCKTIASLPRSLRRRIPGGGSEPAVDHPLYDLIKTKPNSNPQMTSWQWIYASMAHKILWGNWYTWHMMESYRTRQLIPLLPDRTGFDPLDRRRYMTTIEGKQYFIHRDEMLHIPHVTLDGVTGKGVIHYAGESLGLSSALEEFASRFFGDGTHNGGIIIAKKPVDEIQRRRYMAEFNAKYKGLGKTHSTVWLNGDVEYHKEDSDADKAQVLQSRSFSISEVARWMNLPPHILRDLSRATFTNIEHQGIELVVYSMQPEVVQIEQAMNCTFLDAEERRDYYVKFDLKGLLRGDIQARTQFYQAMIDRGVFNADDVLALEDMNPQPDGLGKIYTISFNYQNKESITQPLPDFSSILREGPATGRVRIESGDRHLAGCDCVGCRSKRRTVSGQSAIRSSSVALRRRLTHSYIPQFASAARSVVNEEIASLRPIVEESLSSRSAGELEARLAAFYQEFEKQLRAVLGGVVGGFAAAILPVAEEEVGLDIDVTGSYGQFTQAYIETAIKRHIESSKGQILSLLEEYQDETEAAEALGVRLAEWAEKRPGKMTHEEAYRGENAFSRQAWVLVGVPKIQSVAYGSDSCPYCLALHGKTVGIMEDLLPAGAFLPEGAEIPLTLARGHKHPPYHGGCECGIAPGF